MDLVADEFGMFAILQFHINFEIAGVAAHCRAGLFVECMNQRGWICSTRGSLGGQRELLAHDSWL